MLRNTTDFITHFNLLRNTLQSPLKQPSQFPCTPSPSVQSFYQVFLIQINVSFYSSICSFRFHYFQLRFDYRFDYHLKTRLCIISISLLRSLCINPASRPSLLLSLGPILSHQEGCPGLIAYPTIQQFIQCNCG